MHIPAIQYFYMENSADLPTSLLTIGMKDNDWWEVRWINNASFSVLYFSWWSSVEVRHHINLAKKTKQNSLQLSRKQHIWVAVYSLTISSMLGVLTQLWEGCQWDNNALCVTNWRLYCFNAYFLKSGARIIIIKVLVSDFWKVQWQAGDTLLIEFNEHILNFWF